MSDFLVLIAVARKILKAKETNFVSSTNIKNATFPLNLPWTEL
jgi:hypothetical protein